MRLVACSAAVVVAVVAVVLSAVLSGQPAGVAVAAGHLWARPALRLGVSALGLACVLKWRPPVTSLDMLTAVAAELNTTPDGARQLLDLPTPAYHDDHWRLSVAVADRSLATRSFSCDVQGAAVMPWACYGQVQRYLQRHPEALDLLDRTPVVWVLGPPRTGTTAVLTALSQHPSAVAPGVTELTWPVAGCHGAATAEQYQWQLRATEAALQAVLPAEDFAMHSFLGTPEVEQAASAGYMWFGPSTMGDTNGTVSLMPAAGPQRLRRLRRLLAALLHFHYDGGRGLPPSPFLVVKGVMVLAHTTELAEVFPGSRFVVTQRDPVAAVRSLVAMSRWMCAADGYSRTDAVVTDAAVYAGWVHRQYAQRLEEGLAASSAAAGSITAVRLEEYQRDPAATVAAVVDALRLPALGDAGTAALHRWAQQETALRREGRPVATGSSVPSARKPSLQQLGLTAEEVREGRLRGGVVDADGRPIIQ